jgi:gluconate 5-dehydrogenase
VRSASEAFSLAGEIAVITGGGSGLGLGMGRAFVSAGARVVLVGRRERVLREAVDQLGAQATFVVHDVTRFAEASSFIDRIASEIGTPTILVNNAGNHLKKSALETTPEEFQAVLDTHVMASFALTRAVAPGMVAHGRGSIVFIASMASYLGIPQVVAYTAAKSAYVGMVRSLAVELGPSGIRVNGIAPGWIDTDMLRRAVDHDPPRKARILARTPLGRFGDPAEIGWTAVFLCSPGAAFVSGVMLPVDGGAVFAF